MSSINTSSRPLAPPDQKSYAETMNKTQATKQISRLEAQLKTLKQFLIGKPKAGVDEKNWRAVKPAAKRARQSLFRQRYGKT